MSGSDHETPPPTQIPQSLPPLPSHLAAILNGRRDSPRAYEVKESLWQHFREFLADKGYRIAWDGDNLGSPELRVAVNPFSPRADEAFAAATAGRGVRWGGPRTHPFLMGAYDRSQRFVVLKIVSSHGAELSILRGLTAPAARQDPDNHTIPVLEYLWAGDWAFIVMASWEVTLRECVPISAVEEFLMVAIQSLQGLAYLHRQEIAHLDIYSSNILINHVAHRPSTPFLGSFDFRVGYIDFEYSVRVSQENPVIDVSRLPPTYHGLPEVRGRRGSHVNAMAADVFALGMVLREHVRAQIEFEGDNLSEHRPSHELLRGPSQYLALLGRMSSEEPTERPSAEEALDAATEIRSRLGE